MGQILTLGVCSKTKPVRSALRSPRVRQYQLQPELVLSTTDVVLDDFRRFMPCGTRPLHQLNYRGSGGMFYANGRCCSRDSFMIGHSADDYACMA